MQNDGQLINVARVCGVNNVCLRNVANIGNFALQTLTEWFFAAANNDVGLNATTAQLGHTVLSGFCFLFAARANKRNQCDVDVAHVVAPGFVAELANGLEKRQNFDVANGSAHFRNNHIDIVGRHTMYAALNFVGDVRNDLHCFSEVVTAPLCG